MNKRFPKIGIILLNWNGKKDTLECLASLEKIDYPNFQPIVVDNGSTDDSVFAIRSAYPHIPILETKENLGFAGGNNVGIEWCLRKKAEWIFLLNNDTIVAPDVLQAFLAAAKEQPKAKILGAKIFRYSDPNRIDHLGGFWNPKIGEFESNASGEIDHIYLTDMQKADYVCGAALFMHRSVPETIGLLEPRYFLFWEESDYCMRANRAGLEVWTAPKARIWHKVSASFSGGKPHMHYFWWRSRLLFVSRNCTAEERKELYRKIILPELWKCLRHLTFRWVQQIVSPDQDRQMKLRRYQAGCRGAIDYFRGRFGNCPSWLLKK